MTGPLPAGRIAPNLLKEEMNMGATRRWCLVAGLGVVAVAFAAWASGALAGGDCCKKKAEKDAAAASEGCGEGGCPMAQAEGGPEGWGKCFDEIKLDDKQREAVKKAGTVLHKKTSAAREKTAALCKEIAGLLLAKDEDAKAVAAKIDEAMASQRACLDARVEFHRGLRGVLTAEQLAHLAGCAGEGCKAEGGDKHGAH